ncbi:MAG: rubrerythrin family protein [Candidatus Lokiarchaeota archaeon]|nr:rubrerythrin family protein [Candidatus Lokiarchaeota archaeon]
MTAFAGESQANRKYLAYAEKAEKDGFLQIAKVFRAAAVAESIHAQNHFRTGGHVNNTVENLIDAISGEHYEFTSMYPDFLTMAIQEGNKKAEKSFHWANEVEKMHHRLYTEALSVAKSEKDLEEKEMWVCSICGATFEGNHEDLEEICPVCQTKKDKYIKID